MVAMQIRKKQKALQYALVDVGATHEKSLRLSARFVFSDK